MFAEVFVPTHRGIRVRVRVGIRVMHGLVSTPLPSSFLPWISFRDKLVNTSLHCSVCQPTSASLHLKRTHSSRSRPRSCHLGDVDPHGCAAGLGGVALEAEGQHIASNHSQSIPNIGEGALQGGMGGRFGVHAGREGGSMLSVHMGKEMGGRGACWLCCAGNEGISCNCEACFRFAC
jgi:hypothetical protein